MGARWYDPTAAQFRTRDTVFGELQTPVSLNRYTYGFANPLLYWDPDGRFPQLGPLIDGQVRTRQAAQKQAKANKKAAEVRAQKVYDAASSRSRKSSDEMQDAVLIGFFRWWHGAKESFTPRYCALLDKSCEEPSPNIDLWAEAAALLDSIEEFLSPYPAEGDPLYDEYVAGELEIGIIYPPFGGRFPGSGPRVGPTAPPSLVGASYGRTGIVVQNPGLSIQGFGGSVKPGHAIHQIVSRGVTPNQLLNTIRNPVVVLEQAGGRYLYLTDEAAVVMRGDGQVVTAWTKSEFLPHIQAILQDVLGVP
jgi:hypothetical protein